MTSSSARAHPIVLDGDDEPVPGEGWSFHEGCTVRKRLAAESCPEFAGNVQRCFAFSASSSRAETGGASDASIPRKLESYVPFSCYAMLGLGIGAG